MVPTVNLLTSILRLRNGLAVTGHTRSLTLLPSRLSVLRTVQECSADDVKQLMSCGGNNTLELVLLNLLIFNSTLLYLLVQEERRLAQRICPVDSFANNNDKIYPFFSILLLNHCTELILFNIIS